MSTDPAPRDVVPGRGLTREHVIRLNDQTGKPVCGTIPGRVLLDLDGVPTAVESSREVRSIFGGLVLTRRELAALDLTPEDVPNVRLIDLPERKSDDH